MSSKKHTESCKRELSVSGMSFLRGSASYVWCTTSVLGKGATGAVYQGVNRHTGEAVAVKTFNQMSHMRPQEVQMREFEVLKKVNHRNIVKLLAIEEEQESRGKVIVMELCTGGSLFNILDDPENSFGLEEKEFLLVLHHLASGMKHLRDNDLVHRDLKPGNIMRFIGLDGATVYKLTDFGAARELREDQEFMSLYGTEEYLHPNMYERAVLRKTAGKSFSANVDLWSIGVTLYHVATGMLPFRPHGGRRNKETMYRITTEKQPGVISGVQNSDNGPIEWSTDLPPTCQLSLGLRKLVTPLLGGLLEVDPDRCWKFERFFSEVTDLLAHKKIFLFYVNKIQPLTVYMLLDHRYEQLQMLVHEQSEVPPSKQLLLLGDSQLNRLLHSVDTSPASSFPATYPDAPIMLFSTQDQDITLALPKTPSLKFPSFPHTLSVDQDALAGKNICSVGYAIARVVRHHAQCVALIHQAVNTFRRVLVSEVKEMVIECERARQDSEAVSDSFQQLVTHHRRFLSTCFVACPNTGISPATPAGICPAPPTGSAPDPLASSASVFSTTSGCPVGSATTPQTVSTVVSSDEEFEAEGFVHISNVGLDQNVYDPGNVNGERWLKRVGLSRNRNVVSSENHRHKVRKRSSSREGVFDNRASICSSGVNGNNITAMRDHLEDLVNNLVDEEKNLSHSMESLTAVTEQLRSRLVEGGLLEDTWRQHEATISAACHITTTLAAPSKSKGVMPPPITAPAMSLTPTTMPGAHGGCESAVEAMSKTPTIANNLVGKLKDSWQHLLRDRAARTLTFNDEQFHLLEKLKMKETAKSLECLLNSCSSTLHASTDGLADWCKVATVQRIQAEIASSDVRRHREVLLDVLRSRLSATQDTYHATANRLYNAVRERSIAAAAAAAAASGGDKDLVSTLSSVAPAIESTENTFALELQNNVTAAEQLHSQLKELNIEEFASIQQQERSLRSEEPNDHLKTVPVVDHIETLKQEQRRKRRILRRNAIKENMRQTHEKQEAAMRLLEEHQALTAELLRRCGFSS